MDRGRGRVEDPRGKMCLCQLFAVSRRCTNTLSFFVLQHAAGNVGLSGSQDDRTRVTRNIGHRRPGPCRSMHSQSSSLSPQMPLPFWRRPGHFVETVAGL